MATSVAFDFKGHATSEQRQLVTSKTTQPDWSDLLGESTIAAMATAAASLLDSETFTASSERDALGRVLVAISPDDSEVLYSYDEGGGLQKVELKHRGSTTLQTVVGDITYNARGQREQVIYGSTSSPTMTTSYGYDPQTYRLAHMSTIRESDDASLQGLHYHYDPVGNITDIRDSAQQTVYFQNSVVEAANSYEYDAVYRLIEATGREHSTQGTTQRTHEQISVGAQPMTSDPSAMRRYTQKYTYDSVGNILTMQHIPASGSGWTRYYQYDEDGNRLEATSAPGDDPEGPYTHTYSYDAHGSMTAMPHLSSMIWNHEDELREVTVGTETVYFQYTGGMRSRKYTEKPGSTTEERIYLGAFEIYRKRVSGTLDLERESLHISDGTGRICIVETKTVGTGSPVVVWRYQLGNHLGSAATEVDESGDVISYEEYHPYGTSAYRAVDSSVDVSAKRYRYTGMERDEETGLAYHSARYLVPWLGRWTATDRAGLVDGINRYSYARNGGINAVDRNGNTGITAVSVDTPMYDGTDKPGNWDPIASTLDEEGSAATEWLWVEADSELERSVAKSDAASRKRAPKQTSVAASASASDNTEDATTENDGATSGGVSGFVRDYYGSLASRFVAYGEALGEHAGGIAFGFSETYYDVAYHPEGVGAGIKKKASEFAEATIDQVTSDIGTVVTDGYIGTTKAVLTGDLAGARDAYSKGGKSAWNLAAVITGGGFTALGVRSWLKGLFKGKGKGPQPGTTRGQRAAGPGETPEQRVNRLTKEVAQAEAERDKLINASPEELRSMSVIQILDHGIVIDQATKRAARLNAQLQQATKAWEKEFEKATRGSWMGPPEE